MLNKAVEDKLLKLTSSPDCFFIGDMLSLVPCSTITNIQYRL